MKRTALLLLFCLLLTSCAAPQTGAPALTSPSTIPYTFGQTEPSPTTVPPQTEGPVSAWKDSCHCPPQSVTFSYVDDDTCLRSCLFCGEQTFAHELYEDWSKSGLSCLWVTYCEYCEHEVGEAVFKHSYTNGFQAFDGENHGYYCTHSGCDHWSDMEPHQFVACPYTRNGQTYVCCKVCNGYVPTGETVAVPPCEKHKLSFGAFTGKWTLQDGEFGYLYPCEHCNEMFSYKEYLEWQK